ncbi:MAG: hypothetical protein ACKO9I_02605 [Sphaerospermopsis kisseleviana]
MKIGYHKEGSRGKPPVVALLSQEVEGKHFFPVPSLQRCTELVEVSLVPYHLLNHT